MYFNHIYIFNQSNSTCNTSNSDHQWNYLKVTCARKHPSIYKRRIKTGRAFLFSISLEDSWVLASSLGLSCCPSNCELLLEIETVEQSPLPLEWVQSTWLWSCMFDGWSWPSAFTYWLMSKGGSNACNFSFLIMPSCALQFSTKHVNCRYHQINSLKRSYLKHVHDKSCIHGYTPVKK